MSINKNGWKAEMMPLREKRQVLVCTYKTENNYQLMRKFYMAKENILNLKPALALTSLENHHLHPRLIYTYYLNETCELTLEKSNTANTLV